MHLQEMPPIELSEARSHRSITSLQAPGMVMSCDVRRRFQSVPCRLSYLLKIGTQSRDNLRPTQLNVLFFSRVVYLTSGNRLAFSEPIAT
jgi:hypothetical protein